MKASVNPAACDETVLSLALNPRLEMSAFA
jgi:hypothetical protein